MNTSRKVIKSKLGKKKMCAMFIIIDLYKTNKQQTTIDLYTQEKKSILYIIDCVRMYDIGYTYYLNNNNNFYYLKCIFYVLKIKKISI